jgi:hypothetical protein
MRAGTAARAGSRLSGWARRRVRARSTASRVMGYPFRRWSSASARGANKLAENPAEGLEGLAAARSGARMLSYLLYGAVSRLDNLSLDEYHRILVIGREQERTPLWVNLVR